MLSDLLDKILFLISPSLAAEGRIAEIYLSKCTGWILKSGLYCQFAIFYRSF